MKPQMPESVIRSVIFSVAGFVLGAGMAQNAFANPSGATVVHGSAQFAMPAANTLEITNSANAIINWQSFNIGQGEITRFIQPSADSAVLNRVTGANVSELLGNLSSNGHVFLINPHGIVVGENAVIDVAGFVASTLNLSNEDFLNGRFNFQGENAGALINRGLVTAGPGGELVLIAPQIENHGVLSVDNGALLLAAGEKVTLTRFDLNGIEFEVQAPGNSVLNLGELIARRGAVGVFAGSIDHRGIIEANALGVDAAGNIVLQAQSAVNVDSGASIVANGADGGDIRIQTLSGDTMVSGDVEAAGNDGKGGSIKILGERVGLTGQADINASGSNGGGEILVGGDYRGLNADIQNASATFVGEDVRLAADSTLDGDGGKVIAWADETTRMYGSISATGGSINGDGGFVETSGKQYLEVGNYAPDVSAVNGGGGEWLLDPHNITIQSITGSIDAQSPNFLPTADSSTISVGVIQTVLDGNGTVTIDTNSGSGITEPGDVLFNALITKTTTGTGTLQVFADGNIILASGISAGGGGLLNLDFVSDRNLDGIGGIDFRAAVLTNGGNARFVSNGTLGTGQGILMNGSGDLDVGAGVIDMASNTGVFEVTGSTFPRIRSTNQITVASDSFNFPTGGRIGNDMANLRVIVKPATNGGTVNLGGSVADLVLTAAQLGSAFTARELVIGDTATGNITVGGAITLSPTNLGGSLTLRSSSDIIFNQGAQTALALSGFTNGAVTLDAGGAIIDNSPSGIEVFAGSSVGRLSLLAENGINIQTDVNVLDYQNTVSGDVNVINNFAGTLTLQNSSNSGGGSTTIDHTNATGGMALSGTITQSGGVLNLIASGPGQAFTLSAGGITNNGDINIVADNIDIQSGVIDASAGGTTTLKPVDSTISWLLGGIADATSDLTETELNRVMNNIALGGPSPTLAGVNIVELLTFSNNQNLTIETAGTILFSQTGSGITNAGLVHLIAGSVANGAMGADITSNRLIIDTANGIGSLVVPLETRVNELVATNTTSGEIGISNTTSSLRIDAPGVQNLGTAGNISIINSSGSIFVDGLVDSVTGNVALRATGIGADIIATTDIVAASDVTLSAGRDLIIHAGPGPTTDARVRAGNLLNLGVGRNLALISDTASNDAAIVSNNASFGAQNGIELETGDILLVGGMTVIGLLNMGGGSATFNGATDLTGLTMTGGTLDGTGNVDISGATAWSGGSMAGTGVTAANGGLNINGAVTLNRILSNAGAGIWQGMGDISGTGTFNNLGGGSLDITNNQSMTATLFNNGGNVIKSSTGTTQFNGYTQSAGVSTLAGIVNIDTLNLGGGTLDGAGAVNVATAFNWTGGIMGGAGTTVINGSLLIDGPVVLDRTFNNNGSGVWQGANDIGGMGTFNNLGPGVLDITNNQNVGVAFNNAGIVNKTSTGTTMFFNYGQTGGTTIFDGSVGIDTLNLAGGVLDGSGNVNVGAGFNWTGGAMAGTGTTTSNGNLLIDGMVQLDRTLNNVGSGIWQGAGDISSGGAGAGGAGDTSSGGVFNNTGVLMIANNRFMGPAFNNAGAVEKTSTGTTSFVGGYQQTSGVTKLNGGTLELAEGELLLTDGVLTGTGTVKAPLFNHSGGMIAPGNHDDGPPNYTAQYGTLIIDGDWQMGSNAGVILDLAVSSELGGVAGTDFDLLNVTGNAQLNGMLMLAVDVNRFNAVVGDTFPVIRYASQSGAFSAGDIMPLGYAFSSTVMPQGLGVTLTAVPLRDTALIPDDELERLKDEFRENISRIKQERQRRRQEEEEEKRRRAMMCS